MGVKTCKSGVQRIGQSKRQTGPANITREHRSSSGALTFRGLAEVKRSTKEAEKEKLKR